MDFQNVSDLGAFINLFLQDERRSQLMLKFVPSGEQAYLAVDEESEAI